MTFGKLTESVMNFQVEFIRKFAIPCQNTFIILNAKLKQKEFASIITFIITTELFFLPHPFFPCKNWRENRK
jgi:hypothetical protein